MNVATNQSGDAAPRSVPRVSIIIPTLNEARLIEPFLTRFSPALRSRLRLELIVSDGGSTDATQTLASPLVDVVVVHTRPERQTIATGRNAGAALARGDVLLFLNADVRLPEDAEGFLGAMIDAARRTGAATCRVGVHPTQARWNDRLVLGTCDRLFWLLNKVGMGMGRGECQAVMRKAFDAVGGYRADLVAGEDFDLFHRLAAYFRARKAGRITFLWNQMLYEDPRRYRQRGYVHTMAAWFANFLSVTFRNRSHATEWEVIR